MIIDKIENEFSKIAKRGLINRGKTLEDDKSFNKSIAKARRAVIDAKTKNKSILQSYANINNNIALRLLSRCISGLIL